MQPALRPMSTAQVLDRTFHVYRNYFLLLAGIGVLLPILLFVLRLAAFPLGYPPRGASLRDPFLFWTIFLEYMAAFILVYVIGHAITGGAAVYAVARIHLGEPVTIADAYRKTLPRFWSILRIAVTIYIRVTAVGILALGASILLSFGIDPLLGLLGISSSTAAVTIGIIVVGLTALGGALWMLHLYSKYCLSIAVCVLEGLPARPALRRSRFLARGSLRRISLIYLLTAVLGLVLSTVLWLPSQFYAVYVPHSLTVAIFLRSIGSFLAGALAGPIATTAVALVYYDQRIRKEAFDLQLMINSIAQPPAEPTPATTLDLPGSTIL